MRNPYFDTLGPGVALLKDSKYSTFLRPAPLHGLVAVDSLFTCPGVQLTKDPGYRSYPSRDQGGKTRRQSMLL